MTTALTVTRRTHADWTSLDPVLTAVEVAVEIDTLREKYGNGVAAWSALPYVNYDLGLISSSDVGGAGLLEVGTTASTVAAGDDSRIVGAAQKSANLSDLTVAATARTNLGLAGAAVLAVGTTTGTVAAGDDSRIVAGGTALQAGAIGVSVQAYDATYLVDGDIGVTVAAQVDARFSPTLTTTAALAAVGNAINTTDKYIGKQVFNTDTGSPCWAEGAAAADVWNDGVGTTAHTPV